MRPLLVTWVGGGYSWSSGTSMATPHVSGAAALLWAAAPGAQPTDISSSLLGGVDALPAFTGRTVSGGRLNVLRSLRLVADVGAGSPAPAPEPGSDPGGFRRALLVQHRLRVRVRASEACSVGLVLRLHGRALTAPVQVGVRRDAARRVTLRLNRRGLELLSHHGSFPLTLVGRAVDPAGNRRTLNVGLRVSR